jgi:sterol desaturase/sphingolipid hydroxylase (fatty acid hydroxylase superfamily)|tara:strand:+ start:1468 stop:2343 length:876 start_codon:yes stop_codon:yes gene_type:complete
MEYIKLLIYKSIEVLEWIFNQILFNVPFSENYFWGLIIISLVVWIFEIIFPWRKSQKIFRKGFWIDIIYMFFNFFLFSIIIVGFYEAFNKLLYDLSGIASNSIALIDLSTFSQISQLIIFFITLDFFQWLTHIMMHRFDFLWKFHKVHHSVKEMGFAAHFHYHWMENILYKPLKVFAVMLIGGFEPEQAYLIHFLTITIGHLNHSNIKLSYGALKYIFNNPIMHLHHHASSSSNNFKTGVNFAISLSIWDYIFKTNYIPNENGDTKLGYEGDQSMAKSFFGQLFYGFKKGD